MLKDSLPRRVVHFRWAVLGIWTLRWGVLVGVLVALKAYGVI